MPYYIWDTPDYQDLDKKLWAVTKVSGGLSTGITIWQSVSNFLPASGRTFLLMFANHFIPNVAAANVAMLTAYCTAKARGNVDNHWNYLPAAASFAGTLSLLRFQSVHPAGARFAFAFLGFLPILVAKYGHMRRQGGLPHFVIGYEYAADAFGSVRSSNPAVELMPQDWGRRQ